MPAGVSKLVLFDIDGTLLLTDGAGRRAIRKAMIAALGDGGFTDTVRFDGKTDPQIVQELLEAAGHHQAKDLDRIRTLCEEYVALLEPELIQSPSVRLLAGVETLLSALDQRSDTLLGLLTGNMAAGARLKLTYAGLDPDRFRVGAFGSDAMDRRELPAFAARRASSIMGAPPSGHAMVIIGDTPNDMICGADLGARAIGVATGSYTVDDLRDAGAFAAFEDLGNTEAVLAAIYE